MEKRLKIASFVIQGLYSLVCVADILLCLLYRVHWDTVWGGMLADIAMHLTCCFFLASGTARTAGFEHLPGCERQETSRTVDRLDGFVCDALRSIFHCRCRDARIFHRRCVTVLLRSNLCTKRK